VTHFPWWIAGAVAVGAALNPVRRYLWNTGRGTLRGLVLLIVVTLILTWIAEAFF
jgi:sensor histidine kinase regulating citrate/malate metabolism